MRRAIGRVTPPLLLASLALLVALGAAHAASGNGPTGNAAISADGRFVALASEASDLVPGDTNNVFDVFVRDRERRSTERVSLGPAGVQANARTGLSAISADGRFVVMWSEASNLVADDTNGVSDIFVRDRVGKTTQRVSVGTGGAQADQESAQVPSLRTAVSWRLLRLRQIWRPARRGASTSSSAIAGPLRRS
jgi:hypothetical protein